MKKLRRFVESVEEKTGGREEGREESQEASPSRQPRRVPVRSGSGNERGAGHGEKNEPGDDETGRQAARSGEEPGRSEETGGRRSPELRRPKPPERSSRENANAGDGEGGEAEEIAVHQEAGARKHDDGLSGHRTVRPLRGGATRPNATGWFTLRASDVQSEGCLGSRGPLGCAPPRSVDEEPLRRRPPFFSARRRRRPARRSPCPSRRSRSRWAAISSYAVYRRDMSQNARTYAYIGRFLETLPRDATACAAQDAFEMRMRELTFLAWPRRTVGVRAAEIGAPPEACATPPFTWILPPGDASTCAHLKARWPDGVLEEHRTRGRELVFESFTVPGGSPASRGR